MAERKRSNRCPKPPNTTEVGSGLLSSPRLTSRRPASRRPTRILPRSSSQPLLRTARSLLDPNFECGIKHRSALILPGLQASFHSPPRHSFSFDEGTKVVVSVAVEGSPGPVRVMMRMGASVEEAIAAVVDKYSREGRSPQLDRQAADSFQLHHSHFSLQSLNKSNKIGEVGGRSFYLQTNRISNTFHSENAGSDLTSRNSDRELWKEDSHTVRSRNFTERAQVMEDQGRSSERSSSVLVQAKAPSLAAPRESLLSRLDQFDLRLKQLEGTHRLLPAADCYFTADLHLMAPRCAGGKHRRSTSLSTMHDLELKDALLDRLHLLETRIHQLSLELDKDIGGGGTSKTPSVGSAISGRTAPVKTVARAEKNERRRIWSWKTGVLLKSGARELPSQKPTIKVKELEKAVGAAEKAVGAACQNERRRAERNRLYRRWPMVGC